MSKTPYSELSEEQKKKRREYTRKWRATQRARVNECARLRRLARR